MSVEKTEKIYTDPIRCKGCGYCINACPKEAISFSDYVNP
ncbi:MAG: 4Fe-4S binding protein [Clostridiales bacterium]|nr:4Fe-4S binding protein [Clostridiales bacterium]